MTRVPVRGAPARGAPARGAPAHRVPVQHHDDGAAGMVTLFAVLLFLGAAIAGIAAAGDLGVTAARARSAADAAALAGIATSPLVSAGDPGAFTDPPAGAAARQVAAANQARLVGDDTGGWPLRYRVTVEVEPATGWVRGLVGPVRAEAVGAVRPRLPPAPPTLPALPAPNPARRGAGTAVPTTER